MRFTISAAPATNSSISSTAALPGFSISLHQLLPPIPRRRVISSTGSPETPRLPQDRGGHVAFLAPAPQRTFRRDIRLFPKAERSPVSSAGKVNDSGRCEYFKMRNKEYTQV